MNLDSSPPLFSPSQVACLIAVPLMCASFYMMLQSGAGNDGLLGKEAYESAANIADETLSSMSTIASFVGETKAASRYEAHLGEAEEAAIRQVSHCSYFTTNYISCRGRSEKFVLPAATKPKL